MSKYIDQLPAYQFTVDYRLSLKEMYDLCDFRFVSEPSGKIMNLKYDHERTRPSEEIFPKLKTDVTEQIEGKIVKIHGGCWGMRGTYESTLVFFEENGLRVATIYELLAFIKDNKDVKFRNLVSLCDKYRQIYFWYNFKGGSRWFFEGLWFDSVSDSAEFLVIKK